MSDAPSLLDPQTYVDLLDEHDRTDENFLRAIQIAMHNASEFATGAARVAYESALAEATDMAAIALIEGMEREREACAVIAETPIFTANENDAATAKAIAMLIRARGSE